MTLKEQMHADVEHIFFNDTEMAEWHTLNGTQALVVVDSDKLAQWNATNLAASISLPGMALARAEVFLSCAATAIPEPQISEVVWYDGRPLRVQGAAVIDGMLELVLGGNA